jgi:hypothetical protein
MLCQTLPGPATANDALSPSVHTILLGDPLLRWMLPRWVTLLPQPMRRWLVQHRAPPILRCLREADPELADQSEDYARHIGLTRRDLELVLVGELLLEAGGAGCSAMGLAAPRTDGLGPMLIRALDLPPSLERWNVARWDAGAGRLRSVSFSLLPLPGCLSGMNDFLAISLNVALTTRRGLAPIPASFWLSAALARCRSTREAVALLRRKPFAGGALITVVDRDSDLAVVEVAGDLVRVREGEAGAVVATNHYQDPDCIACERNNEGCGGAGPPPIQPSSNARAARLWQILAQLDAARRRVAVPDAIAILRDSGPGKGPCNDRTICRMNHFYRTISAMVMLPRLGEVHVASGLPLDRNFTRLILERAPSAALASA